MTAATLTIADFLLARIAEDEAALNFDPAIEPWLLYRVGHTERCDYPGDAPGYCTCGAVPRVLAECAAKRAIVEEHQPVDYSDAPRCSTCCADWGDHYVGSPATEKMYPCPTIRHLATVYADREGYREEWRV